MIKKFGLTKESVSDYALNYNNTALLRTANTSVSQLSSAYQNEDFLKTLFALSTNEFSKPIVLGKDIAVLKVETVPFGRLRAITMSILFGS